MQGKLQLLQLPLFYLLVKEKSKLENYAVSMRGVTKAFGTKVVANKSVDFDLKYGTIVSLLGENGSGKTTLMNMLSGIYFPDSGTISIDGKEVMIKSPHDAMDLGIGMVHQHFKLVDVFTAAENIVLGLEGKLKIDEVAFRVKEICDKYGFEVDPYKKVYSMSVAEKQTLEIVKVLYRGANVLILDEPTAVLTPQETKKLFSVMRNMKADGKSIIIITHKLNEVLEISDEIAVLRKGEYVGTVKSGEATEESLTELMVGEKVELNIYRSEPKNTELRLNVEHLTVTDHNDVKTLDDVSFKAYSGEILGIAGISGCGQRELLETIAGLIKPQENSSVLFTPNKNETEQLIGKSPRKIRECGVELSFVPEDRLGMGLVGSMGMPGNMMLRSYTEGNTPFLQSKKPRKLSAKIKEELGVLTPGINTPVRQLSGGNVQKVLVGREIANAPSVLMTAYAVRGLDINTSYTIYNLLNKQKEEGVAVVYVGEDLDVLLALSDKILVLCDGKVNGLLDARSTTKEEVGLLMTNLQNNDSTSNLPKDGTDAEMGGGIDG